MLGFAGQRLAGVGEAGGSGVVMAAWPRGCCPFFFFFCLFYL